MLTLDQSREYTRFKKLDTFFDNNGSAISTYPPFQTEVAAFHDNFEQLEALIPQKDGTGNGYYYRQNHFKAQRGRQACGYLHHHKSVCA